MEVDIVVGQHSIFQYSLVHLKHMLARLSSLSKYTAHTTTILFVLGFIFDMVMLPDIDHLITRYIGTAYLFVIAFLIMFREWIVSRNTASVTEQKIYSLSTFGISYFSGSALSFIVVYALRSAAFSVSWPLFLLLVLCIVANEFVATHNFRFILDVGILLFAILFFTIFNLPVLLKTQNDITFAISVGISIAISLFYLYLLQFTSESAKYEAPRAYALAIGIPMFIGMLYFLNVLPAVPLSLKKAAMYHSVVRSDAGDYIAQGEMSSNSFLQKIFYFKTPTYHITETGTTLYFFSAVDAPAELTAPISQIWEQYDEVTKKWVQRADISFTLAGGRENGYRAYSYKENMTEGLWRVSVKVDSSRVVGRIKFKVKKVEAPVETKEISL